MSWKYLVIGLIIIVIPFAILFARINTVSNIIPSENSEGSQQNSERSKKYNGPEDLPESVRQGVKQENSSVLLLSRGRILNFDEESNTIEIAAEDKNREPKKDVIITRTETIDLSSIKQVKCWPEKVPVNNGQEISILDAYFPMKPDSELYLTKETVKTYKEVTEFISTGTFVFVKKKTPTEDPTFTAQQLAIIGC
jgi:hypothetical protein